MAESWEINAPSRGTVRKPASMTLGPGFLFFVSALVLAGSIATAAWWPLTHNYINVSCANNIYYAHHTVACATWAKASGIMAGVTIPLILFGGFGLLGAVAWYTLRRETD